MSTPAEDEIITIENPQEEAVQDSAPDPQDEETPAVVV